MAFTLPSFPLTINIYDNGGGPGGAPRVVTVCNLAYGKRVMTQYWSWGQDIPPSSSVFGLILLPPLTDIRDGFCPGGSDVVEVPAGSGRTYTVDMVDDLGKGFANEHRFAMLCKSGTWPEPIP